MLFKGLENELRDMADRTAKRVAELGGRVVASVQALASRSRLREFPKDALGVPDHVRALLSSYSQYEFATHNSLIAAQKLDDSTTIELLKDVGSVIEKDLWLLDAHLEALAIASVEKNNPAWTSAALGHAAAAGGDGKQRRSKRQRPTLRS